VKADALYFAGAKGSATGGVSTFKVTVEKNDGRDLRVGFYEQEVGGSGPMWRSAGWMAVIMSSFLLGVDPVDYRYTYDIGGRADGPSAGGLMTVATLAALLGQEIRADAAMTGTINPDGTIGPVGGIPHKIDGAAAKGKKLVLVPAGSRMSVDVNTGSSVDVVERGRQKGVTVKEVSDVYEAYELLTGQALPKPVGLKEVRPELPTMAFERTKGKTKEWFARYQSSAQQYSSLPKNVKFEFTNKLLSDASSAGDRADKYFSQGMASAAYAAATEAALNASIGYATSKMVEAYASGGLASVAKYAKSFQTVNTKIDALQDNLRTQKVATMSDTIAISDAYGWLNLAMGISGLADQALQKKVANENEALGVIAEAALYYAVADHAVTLAKDSLDIGMGFGTAAAPSEAKMASLAEIFRRAAEANLTYFNSVVVDGYAQQFGVHPTVMQNRFAQVDLNYVFVYTSLGNIAALQSKAGGGAPGSLAALGGAMNSYALSSGLVAKYYSLGTEVDKDGNISGIQNERAMINMLDFAEKRAKETIGLAVALGTEPVQPVLYYDQAKIEREGSIESKFNALTDFWHAAMQAQAMAMLSGKANVVSQGSLK